MPVIASSLPRGNFPRFSESSPQRSLRDNDATGKQWLKEQQIRQQVAQMQNALSSTNRAVQKMRKKAPTPIMPQNNAASLYPFQVYSPDNQYIQVNGGYIGYRNSWLLPDSVNVSESIPYYCGNFELILTCGGTDLAVSGSSVWSAGFGGEGSGQFFGPDNKKNTGTIITVPSSGTPTLISSNSPTSTMVVPDGGFRVRGPDLTATGEFGGVISFWIELKDSQSTGPYCELWAKFGTSAATYWGENYLHSQTRHSTTISIGTAYVGQTGKPTAFDQVQVGHLTNRYLSKIADPSNNANTYYPDFPNVFRGKWSSNSLSGMVFYPGDVVIDDTQRLTVVGTSGAFAYYKAYVWPKAQMEVVSVAPHTSGAWDTAYMVSD